MTETQTETTARVIYTGLTRLTGNKAGHWYQFEDGRQPSGVGFMKPLVPGVRIGTVIEITRLDDRSTYTSGPKGPRVVDVADVSDEQLAKWQVATDLIKVEDAQAYTARRISREVGTPLDDAIETLRAALDGLPWHKRAAAINMIVSRLR